MTHTPVYWSKLTGTGYWYQKIGQCVWPFSHLSGYQHVYNDALRQYQMSREASVAEVDEADGGEGVHQLFSCPLNVTFVQLGVVRDRQ